MSKYRRRLPRTGPAVWVNLGMYHFPRAEDMPVMPVVWHSFRLRPNDFFGHNPAVGMQGEERAMR